MKEERTTSSWSELPLELASRILSYIPHKNHATFHVVCKSWSCVTPFHEQHRSPLLFLFRGDQYCMFNPIYNTYQMSIHQPPTTKILFSNFGWLLMRALLHSDSSIFFFNIFTKERIDLPHFCPPPKRFSSNLPVDLQIAKFSFSSSPTSSDCFVVGVSVMSRLARICLTKPGEKNWIVKDIDFTISNKPCFFMSECNPIFHNGQCFCLDIDGRVAIFDLKDPESTWRICGKPFSNKSEYGRQVFMVESDGELLSATVSEEGQIYIYKLHSSQVNWINMTNLDNKILYLSYTGSHIETTNFKGMGNKIYFPKFEGDRMVFYSMDTKKYHSYGDKFRRENVHNLCEPMYFTWIKPMF